MKLKACLAILLCLVLGVTLMPVTAQAGGGKEYTVVLDPGEGSGTPIVYSANYDEITESFRGTTEKCVFCLDVDGSVWFRLDGNYCPESFTAPEGYEFDGWNMGRNISVSPGKTTTCTAKWRILPDPKYAIGNIKPVSSGKKYMIGGRPWEIIGEDKDKGIGLMCSYFGDVTPMTLQDGMDTCDVLFKNFTESEQKLVIPTSKTEEKYTTENGIMTIAPALEKAKVFFLSAGEVQYYESQVSADSYWTRSENGEKCEEGIIWNKDHFNKSLKNSKASNILPVFQIDLNAYNNMAQALPPDLPEGTFKSKSGTYQITNKNKKTVQLIEGELSAKGTFTIPKTVTYENTKYKVTAVSGMTFDGNSELKTIRITAGNLKKIGKYAFRFINSKAVFKIKGTKTQFKKIKKLIQASKGVPKGVKYQRVK